MTTATTNSFVPTGYQDPNPNRNWGVNQGLNQYLSYMASAAGNPYTGDYGQLQYGDWLKQQSPEFQQYMTNAANQHQMKTGQGARQTNYSQVTNPQLPNGAQFTPVSQQAGAGEIRDPNAFTVDPNSVRAQLYTANSQTATAPGAGQAHTYNATQVNPDGAQMEAAQGQVSQDAQVKAAQGQLSEATLTELNKYAEMAASFDPRALVQTQYAELMDFGPDEIPGWAKGALKAAEQQMAARGMGGSSMAAEASVAALMQAAMPIAQQDAAVFNGLMLKKMDQKAQATFLKAGYLAEMDMANLNNRQQAAVLNAQAFLQMDMANLGNLQQAAVVNTQSRLQAMLSNQAADNAAKQFNAESQNQVDMFFAQLEAQISMFNAEQSNAMSQYNTGQANAMSQFNANLKNAREQFNTQNRTVIDQSNAEYLRQINTQNTTMQNQANYVNAMNMLNISNAAMANEILFARDLAHFTFQSSENSLNRAQNIALTQMANDLSLQRYDAVMSRQTAANLGAWATNLLGDVVQGWMK